MPGVGRGDRGDPGEGNRIPAGDRAAGWRAEFTKSRGSGARFRCDSSSTDAASACPGSWDFCGVPIDSPLGVPAGPLLNSGWILYYASLGFSVLTYKTVRSSYRACYEPPNLLPVRAAPLIDSRGRVTIAPAGAVIDSWAISFGMPSKDPAVWGEDVTRARRGR